MQFFLGKLAPLQENWNPHPLGYLAHHSKNPRILDTPFKYSPVVILTLTPHGENL